MTIDLDAIEALDQIRARREKDRIRQRKGQRRARFIKTVREILSRQHGHPIEREAEIRAALAEMDRAQ